MPTSLIRPFAAEAQAGTTAWGISAVKADESPFAGAGVTIAVLDTGVEAAHPAFAGVTVVEADFSGSGNGDRQGHGTHCAGTILGREVEGTRIGVATGVTSLLAGVLSGAVGVQWAITVFAAIAATAGAVYLVLTRPLCSGALRPPPITEAAGAETDAGPSAKIAP